MNFLRLNGMRATEGEVIAIIRRLDIDADQRITFEEFARTMQDNHDLQIPRHGDPTSPERDDPYFRHTSPVKAMQHRDTSPRRGGGSSMGGGTNTMAMSGSFNPNLEESKGPAKTFNQVTSSPGKNKIEPPAYFNTGPLRPYSPNRSAAAGGMMGATDTQPLRPSSPVRATYSPMGRRPDSPLR